jgi:DNA-binding response OmpR family regulator
MPGKLHFQTVPLAEIALKGLTAQTDLPQPVVLVVDDEHVIADTLAAILMRNGFEAMATYDGRSALEIARAIPPDLLITDVFMPGMSGIDLAIGMRAAIPDCKVLLFSGQASTLDLLAAARDAGHDFALLSKPVHPTEMLARVSACIKPQDKEPTAVHRGPEETNAVMGGTDAHFTRTT